MNSAKKTVIRNKIEEVGIIPVLRLTDTETIFPLLDALAAGGVSCVEFTMTTPDAVETLARCRSRYDGALTFGMGTVTEAEEAERAIGAGADFLVSPVLSFAALAVAQQREIPFAMGAFTPSEVQQAHRAGADYVKLFPFNSLSVSYIRDLQGPLPGVRIIPTGGVTLEQINDLIAAGVAAIGVGGALVSRAAMARKEFTAIRDRAEAFVTAVRTARKPK